MRDIRFIVTLLLISECVVEGRIPLPFLRGGSSAATTITTNTRPMKTKQRRSPRKKGVNPIPLVTNNLKQGLGKVGGKIQHDTQNIGKNIGREWGKLSSTSRKFVSNIPKIQIKLPLRRKNNLKSSKLDEVCLTFASVQRGNEVDTAQLLKACRAHLAFMKTGGSSLRLVAKDLESNVKKAERLYKKSPKECKTLASLLELERKSDIHKGNVLQDPSAAVGLLWIRRSLAFQLDLYASLVHGQIHPREAAYNAYDKHLSPFHGWALRKVFPASLSHMPKREEFIAKFGGIELEELNDEYDRVIAKKLKSLVATWDPLISSWENEFERLDLEDTRRV